jgi:hypothetical protein
VRGELNAVRPNRHSGGEPESRFGAGLNFFSSTQALNRRFAERA